jgi:hypothetical protein
VPQPGDAPPPWEPLALDSCDRLFVDGGSNEGEAVTAFLKGNFFRCGLQSPHRLYNSAWPNLSLKVRRRTMQPLAEPLKWCVRSLDANPKLRPLLLAKEAKLRASGTRNVRYVSGALSTRSTASASRSVVTYARTPWGSTANGFRFEDIHTAGPKALSEEQLSAPSYDIRDIIRRVQQHNSSALIAVRLDVEGDEFAILDALLRSPQLLCSISYLFVENHNFRVNLTNYGFPEQLKDTLKQDVHKMMEAPSCKLKVYWRSYWASCGDEQRFMWRGQVRKREAKERAEPQVEAG